MDPEFWLSKWQRNEIGFHEPDYHRFLTRHWPALGIAPAAPVLVPLCGKSLDLLWLRERGHRVVGIELSERAVEDFFKEQRLVPRLESAGNLRRYQTEGIEILLGDFFDSSPALLPPMAAFYDRAALIALPPALRRRYTEHLAGLLAPNARGLVVTVEYEPAIEVGPPFSVDSGELEAYYQAEFVIDLLAREELPETSRLRQRGLTSVRECAYRLARK